MTTLNQVLEKFGFGHLNPLAETKTIDVDQRRSTSISSMNKALEVYYDRNSLMNQYEYYGIVVGIVDRSVQSFTNKNSWGQREGMSAGLSSPYQIYRVYIPELECRPAPTSMEDPVIATYSEIPVAFDLPMSVSKGAIVKVAYGDPFNMGQPEIVSVEGAIDGAALPVLGSSLAERWNGGTPKAPIQSTQGRVSPDHDRYLDKLQKILERQDFEVHDEYRQPNRYTTAPHFHFETRASTTRLEDPTSTPNAAAFRLVLNRPEYDHITEKGSELSNGGDITVAMKDKLTNLLGILATNTDFNKDSGQKLKFTGGNDRYHQEKHPTSRHTKGEGIDLVLTVDGTPVQWT